MINPIKQQILNLATKQTGSATEIYFKKMPFLQNKKGGKGFGISLPPTYT
jgi:hypothetical protein